MDVNIDISKLKEGQVIKNYKELCEILNLKNTGGNVKKNQLLLLSTWCDYHKQGNKFIIDKIFNKQNYYGIPYMEYINNKTKDSIENNKNYKHIDCFNISTTIMNHNGIYYILQDNNIYIGSTIDGFRSRFRHHYNEECSNKNTYNMLHNGGTFNLLLDMNNIKDEKLVRQIEYEYIKYFKENSKFNVFNKKNPVSIKNKQNNNIKYKTIKIDIRNINEVLYFLDSKNITYK